ncbi:hypothetical protein E2562_001064 [Oryza meyeriana var. granulata]|uniref:DUF642 domain-containing protein n=1 Tax=Oryza meyeriana var. granulata TaxID=110450 RepID=A0A6G1EDK5_9ORYZ|nr:hypothetical protein E2562_001064 [Oryza meyeriana var. granulata]
MATATPRHHLLLPFLLLLLLFAGANVSVSGARDAPGEMRVYGSRLFGADDGPSAYEMLERFGFPRGILPEGVTGYTLRPSDGAFQVFLGTKECEFEVDGGYQLTYQRRISGKVAGGSIRDLQGVTVKIFMMNWGIDRVVMVDAGHLMFYVGPLSQAFPADNFEESPQCRCRHSDGGAAVATR